MPSVSASRRRGRHGRAVRSSATGRHLPPLVTREDEFEQLVGQTVAFVRATLPVEMAGVSVFIALAPEEAIHDDHIDRWVTDPDRKTVTLFRLPISRFDRRHDDDEVQFRIIVEGYVFRALADVLGKDPWDLAQFRYGR